VGSFHINVAKHVRNHINNSWIVTCASGWLNYLMCIKGKCIELCRDCEVFLEVKVGIEEDIIGMESECKKWMIFAFVIAISFSLVMKRALAARHLIQLGINMCEVTLSNRMPVIKGCNAVVITPLT